MAQDTIDFLASVVGGPAHLVDWSDGGTVALLIAIQRPELVRKIAVTGANFKPAPQIDPPEMLDVPDADAPEMQMFRSMYEAASPDGAEHWPLVIGEMAEMFRTEHGARHPDRGPGTNRRPGAGVGWGRRLRSSRAHHRAVSCHTKLRTAVVPGTSHAHFMEKPSLVNRIVLDFLGNDPIPTMMPVRRAAASGSD